MDLISIIVPVYKVEQYIDKCVQSLVNQTYKELEIILVDDGSPDLCPEICDKWAKRDSRIKVVHKNNEGAGKARNVGIKQATGDFIAFVDGDDYVSPNLYRYLRNLMSENNDVDIVECDYIMTFNDNAVFEQLEDKECIKYSSEQAMKEHVADKVFKQVIWNKLYRRNVLRCIFFPEGKMIDDEFWTYQVIAQARRLIHLNCKLYAYRQQEYSVMHEKYSEKRLQAIESKICRLQYIENNMPEIAPDARVNLLFSCFYQGQLILKNFEKNRKDKAMSYLKIVTQKHKVKKKDMLHLSITQKIWIILEKISFVYTCKIRNTLKIGL